MVHFWLEPENLDWFKRLLVYRGAGLGRLHCICRCDHAALWVGSNKAANAF